MEVRHMRDLAGMMMAALAMAMGATAGCAEGGAGNGTTGSGGAGAGSGTTGSGGAVTTASSSTSSSSSSGGKVDHPVINEISAKSDDWVEIANPGATAVDLGDHGLCDDVDPTMGAQCDLTTIVRFPKGTMLPAGGYVLVVGNQPADAGVGPQVMCLASGGPTTCFYATWKISSSNGETVHLLGPGDAPIDEVKYPADAVPSGQTWGRLPDGTGAFAPNQPTPGAGNAAP
jgi:hypothetical protein